MLLNFILSKTCEFISKRDDEFLNENEKEYSFFKNNEKLIFSLENISANKREEMENILIVYIAIL